MENIVALSYLLKMGGTKGGGGRGGVHKARSYLEQGFSVQNYERFKQVQIKTANISTHPFSKGSDAFQISWTHLKGYVFPHSY